MKMEWWALCRVFDLVKTIANGCVRIMERINRRIGELNKKMEEKP